MLAQVAGLTLAAECCRLALELPWNDKVASIPPRFVFLELTIVALLVVATYLLAQRRPLGPCLVLVACLVIGLGEYFVIKFKRSAVLPSDLLALGTAFEVAGGFTYVVGDGCLLALAAVGVGWSVSKALASLAPVAERGGHGSMASNILAGMAALALATGIVVVPDYQRDLGVQRSYWTTYYWYKEQGLIPTFKAMVEDLELKAPDGYSAEAARSFQGSLATEYDHLHGGDGRAKAAADQFGAELPSVVAVMNETFSDLSPLVGEATGYAGPEFFLHGLDDAVLRGDLGVSVLGGGTCNTEFEALTGLSMAFVGQGKYPYTMIDLSSTPSLARQFEALGYATTAIHPAAATNWHRDVAYRQLGFDEFLDIRAFDGAERFHGYPSDKSTYEVVLERLQQAGPQFVFDLTIQNHAGYDTGNVPDELLTEYHITGSDDDAIDAQLSEYLACIAGSDQDLAWFVSELRGLEKKVVLIFFGDHQPGISEPINNVLHPGEDGVGHVARTYHTAYVVWANYEVAGTSGEGALLEDVGSDCLASMALSAVGAPLTDFQKAQLLLHEQVPIVSGIGFRGADGLWYDLGGAEAYDETIGGLQVLDYLNLTEGAGL